MLGNDEEYICLINEEEQYSIWFAWKEIPPGWKQVEYKGNKEEVLKYVTEVWTDMRPKSLREQMDNLEAKDIKTLKPNDLLESAKISTKD
ncbi:MbtH family protein [Candidatus Tisiphia endosymbiont of Ceraclea dissimilis]|uniref:MbtH family protein n=1 Tax=Candidatus Tisiphia endosymbiont of Ceraclea dissimilis TaxID=3077928 RepID=UPI003CCAC8F9